MQRKRPTPMPGHKPVEPLDIDVDSYSATKAQLTAQRAAYARYRTIIDGLRIALERPSRTIVPHLATELAGTFAEIEACWTVILCERRLLDLENGPRVRELRELALLVLQEAALAEVNVKQLSRRLVTRGAALRDELENALRQGEDGTARTDGSEPPQLVDARA